MGPIDLTPLLEQRQDLGLLLGKDAVHRATTRRPVGQLAMGAAGVPAVGTNLAELEGSAGAADGPAGIEGLVDQVEQPGLGGRIHPVWDPATPPQPSFPSTSVSLSASSLHASESREISAFAASSS